MKIDICSRMLIRHFLLQVRLEHDTAPPASLSVAQTEENRNEPVDYQDQTLDNNTKALSSTNNEAHDKNLFNKLEKDDMKKEEKSTEDGEKKLKPESSHEAEKSGNWLLADCIKFSDSADLPEKPESIEVRTKRRNQSIQDIIGRLQKTSKALKANKASKNDHKLVDKSTDIYMKGEQEEYGENLSSVHKEQTFPRDNRPRSKNKHRNNAPFKRHTPSNVKTFFGANILKLKGYDIS